MRHGCLAAGVRAEQGKRGWNFSVSSQYSAFVLSWAMISDPEPLFGLTFSENKNVASIIDWIYHNDSSSMSLPVGQRSI